MAALSAIVHSGGRWSVSVGTCKLENRVVLQVADQIDAWLRATLMPNTGVGFRFPLKRSVMDPHRCGAAE